jgi:hypothetical protein
MNKTLVFGLDKFNLTIFGGNFTRKFGTFRRILLDDVRHCSTPSELVEAINLLAKDHDLVVFNFLLTEIFGTEAEVALFRLLSGDCEMYEWAALSKMCAESS